MGTVIVSLILMILVGLSIRKMIKDTKAGRSMQCGGDCGHCGGQCH